MSDADPQQRRKHIGRPLTPTEEQPLQTEQHRTGVSEKFCGAGGNGEGGGGLYGSVRGSVTVVVDADIGAAAVTRVFQ